MALAALLALSLYIPFLAGQLSLASPGFYALGGYIAAVLATRVLPSTSGSSPVSALLLEMVLAAVASGLLAVAVGVPALRLRGIYFALATIAFVEILRVVSLNLDITGGAVGIFGVPQPFVSQLGYLWIVAPLLVVTMVVDVAPRANAGRPGAGGAPRGRAGRRRHGDQSHVLQDPRLHDGRDAGRCGRGRERALPEHLERSPGDVRRERQPSRLRPHRGLAHLPGARRGRPHPDRAARGPPRRGRHRRAPGLARALPQGRAPHHLRHAHRRRQRVLSSRTDHAGAPAGAAARPRSTRPVGPGRSRRRAAAARGLRGTPAAERQRPARPTSRCAACPAASED